MRWKTFNWMIGSTFTCHFQGVRIPELGERPIDVAYLVRFVAAHPQRFGLARPPQPIETDALVGVLSRRTWSAMSMS